MNTLNSEQLAIWNHGFSRDNENKAWLIAYVIENEYAGKQFRCKREFIDALSDSPLKTISGKEHWSDGSLRTIFQHQPWLEPIVERMFPKKRQKRTYYKPYKNIWDERIEAPVPIPYQPDSWRGDWELSTRYSKGDVVVRRENLPSGLKTTRYRCNSKHRSSDTAFSLDYTYWEKIS